MNIFFILFFIFSLIIFPNNFLTSTSILRDISFMIYFHNMIKWKYFNLLKYLYTKAETFIAVRDIILYEMQSQTITLASLACQVTSFQYCPTYEYCAERLSAIYFSSKCYQKIYILNSNLL